MDVEEHFSHQLEVALANCRKSYTAGDIVNDFRARALFPREKSLGHIDTVDRAILLMVAAGQRDECGEEVGDEEESIFGGARRDMFRPANDAWLAYTSLERCVLRAAEWLAHFFQYRTIIVSKNQERVLLKAILINRLFNPSHGFI